MTDGTDAPPAALPDFYASQYCEENVWHLCRDAEPPAIEDAHALFVSNARRTCALWMQRAAPERGAPVLWDYHVVLLGRREGWKVWDLDSQLPCPLDALAYLDQTFPHENAVRARFRPRFRLVPRPVFLETFASDRSHMRRLDGAWLAPPPPRPPIRTAREAMTLPRFVDLERPYVGRVLDLSGLRDWLSTGA